MADCPLRDREVDNPTGALGKVTLHDAGAEHRAADAFGERLGSGGETDGVGAAVRLGSSLSSLMSSGAGLSGGQVSVEGILDLPVAYSRSAEHKPYMVGVAGFEPTTSSSRTKRATKLRHTPLP